jgi:hypothetical protein
MDRNDADLEHICALAHHYFEGLYKADVESLRSLFHESAMLQAPGLRLTRNAWLERVATRAVPREVSSDNGFRILAVDLAGELAMVKVLCPLFEHRYIDFLTFMKENGRWQIVNKAYADSHPDYDTH